MFGFLSTGQAKSSQKIEDLMEMVKQLQKGHVSSVTGAQPEIWGQAEVESVPRPKMHHLGKLTHLFSLTFKTIF